MFVKPAPGLKIIDPVRNEILPSDGKAVEDTKYWRRRISDGDVIEVKASTPIASLTQKPAKKGQ